MRGPDKKYQLVVKSGKKLSIGKKLMTVSGSLALAKSKIIAVLMYWQTNVTVMV